MVTDRVRGGIGAALLLSIMFLGSLGLWLGTPLLWLWIGGQFQGQTDSIGGALAVAFIGAAVTIALVAVILGRLSDAYRAVTVSRGRDDPGNVVLEGVLVISAGITLIAFGVWFFIFAGASPIPGFNVQL
jgi:MFS family permease